MGAKLGFKAKAYVLPTGTRATWGAPDTNGIHGGPAPAGLTELTNVRDLTLNLSKGEADASTRANNGWEAILPALKNGQVQFGMMWDTTDTTFTTLLNSYLNDASVALAFLDGDKMASGAQGLWADWYVIGFEKHEPLKEGQNVQVTIKPAYSAVPPEWVKVTP